MQLLDDDAGTFEYLVQWLYKRKIIASTVAKKDLMVRYSDLIDLYLLADKYGVLLLKNQVMKSLWEKVSRNRGKVPDTEMISHVGIGVDPFKDVSPFLESTDIKPKSTGSKAA
ncbi:MAG: hypothetical protein Q9208_006925 [Pyrenodesmia sp. 3 TL-2023]